MLCAAAGSGFGALNEVVEFIAVLTIPETNVGGYENTGWDLVANLVLEPLGETGDGDAQKVVLWRVWWRWRTWRSGARRILLILFEQRLSQLLERRTAGKALCYLRADIRLFGLPWRRR